jgi:CHAT domain-containing protein/tetratricopeptide (TPR) repeat protein
MAMYLRGWLAILLTHLVLVPQATAQSTAELSAARERASKLYDQGKYEEGIVEMRKALSLAEQIYGADHATTASVLHDLARQYWSAGQYAKAEPLYRRSLEIKEATWGKDHPNVALTLNNLAIVYKAMGQYARAEPLFQRSLRIFEATLGRDHLQVSNPVNNLAMLYYDRGDYARAEPLYQRSLKIIEANLGKDSVQYSDVLNNLALLYGAMGQNARAEALSKQSLQIKEAILDKGHPGIATALDHLGTLYVNMGQYAKAEPLLQRGLEMREARLGKDHPAVAQSLNGLATLYWTTGQYAKAEPLYLRALEIREAKLGKDHLYVARTLNNLAILYSSMGQYAKAEPVLQRCLEIMEARVGKETPELILTIDNLAELYAAEDKWSDARSFTTRQRQLARLHVRRTLPVLSDRDILDFLHNTDEGPLHVALSIGLERRADPEMASASAGWLINGKAVAQEALGERARLALASADPKTSKVAGELTGVRQQLASLTMMLPRPGQDEARREQLVSLTEQEEQLARKLGQLVGQPNRANRWVTADEVRQAIPKDGILIDIARFRVKNFKPKGADDQWRPTRYAAWLIPPAGQGDVRLIDLGDADQIDAAVAAVRRGLLAAQGTPQEKSVILDKGEQDAEKELQPALAALAKLVLEPLAEHIKDRPQWLVSPDGALWLVPWSALPVSDAAYAIEKHTLRYLVSGRDLVTPRTQAPAKRDPPLLIADPDFDLDPKVAATVAAELLGTRPPADTGATAADDRPDGRRSRGLLGTVARLEGTAREAAAIQPKVKAQTGEDPWVYRGKNALEAVVKAFHSPKVVVLSTHGFFLENQEFKHDDRPDLTGTRSLFTRDGKLPENPLLRCGLLLAGCNEVARVKPGQEDGVLTGLEIAGLDLRDTELVVLSACETGLGQVRNGEGVAGLRQAFQLAGARSVVATLWQVPDNDTALLMGDFFDQLAAGKSKAEALRQAQLARIQAHRKRYGAAHPFYWAAFTITGQ